MTALSSPYSSCPMLAGFLKSRGYQVAQFDAGLELLLRLLSKSGLARTHAALSAGEAGTCPAGVQFLEQYRDCLAAVEPAIAFLQGRDLALVNTAGPLFPTLGTKETPRGTVCEEPRREAVRFVRALAEAIAAGIDDRFAIDGYGDKLILQAPSLSAVVGYLDGPQRLTGLLLEEMIVERLQSGNFDVVAISVPFQGALFGALEMCAYIRKQAPKARIVLGGAFINTEFRALADPGLFDFVDYVVLDEGYLPLISILERVAGRQAELYRTFVREDGRVVYRNGDGYLDRREHVMPDYSDVPLESYFGVDLCENEMDRIWSDRRSLNVQASRGCYWAKCSFCNTGLEQVHRYEPGAAADITAMLSHLAEKTGHNWFHFVDQAVAPGLLRDIAENIITARLDIRWWGNVRIENAFTPGLTDSLARAGCAAVAVGIETTVDRLLRSISKGLTLETIVKVTANFRRSGILVHAYLIYGLPGETTQEAVDNLEAVRQLFQADLLSSGSWHEFSLTPHSDISNRPAEYGIRLLSEEPRFVLSELRYQDCFGENTKRFGPALRQALQHYKMQEGLSRDVRTWFRDAVPTPSIGLDYIRNLLAGMQ